MNAEDTREEDPHEEDTYEDIYTDGHRHVRPVPPMHPTKGGAHSEYIVTWEAPDGLDYDKIRFQADSDTIHFQPDTIQAVGAIGWTNEAVLAVLIDRLEGFQAGEFGCRENAIALTHLQSALLWLEERTTDRKARGVEGQRKP